MQPTPKSSHRDATLSNISVAYRNGLYIADLVFPHVPVRKQSDYFYSFTKGAWFRRDAGVRGPGGAARRGGYVVSDTQYNCIEYAMAHPVPVELINNADDALQPWVTGVTYATDKILLEKEYIVSTLCCTSANWTSSNDAEGGWAAGESNTFIADVLDAKETIRQLIGRYPNTMVMDAKTLKEIKQDSSVLDRIKYTGTQGAPADVTTQTLAQLFELDRVLIGGAIYSDAEEVVAGTDFNAVDLWETTATKGACWLGYVSPNPALMDPTAGYIFEWNGDAGQESRTIAADTYRSVRYWWEDPQKQWVIEASENFDAQVTSADAGYLFYDTILT